MKDKRSGCIYVQPAVLLADRRHSRLARYADPVSAEDDYYRFDNRND
jgi:hypothetical protein